MLALGQHAASVFANYIGEMRPQHIFEKREDGGENKWVSQEVNVTFPSAGRKVRGCVLLQQSADSQTRHRFSSQCMLLFSSAREQTLHTGTTANAQTFCTFLALKEAVTAKKW
mmetsp:Transcript_32514/g.69687  ORF Transcript_32514/g.69687 Transcript_32514/m.69687 type:complete len:113 (-) Transcript_32514:1122-1460(-)